MTKPKLVLIGCGVVGQGLLEIILRKNWISWLWQYLILKRVLYVVPTDYP